ncbi:hypothetical protein H0H87_012823 [Tephrocybe sp. NHM501043]|nr:hypothetical protein H0H87_012823 [Tephrocybe sp. NHM501043]
MDSSLYKTVTTRRSFKYNYYLSAPASGKPFLLFLHGFPSTSYDWRYQVDFFKKEGYGLVVPDMLGYGGTDKPIDPAEYQGGLMARDIIDILDAENIEKAIAIGHDWGCAVVSRLVNYFSDRFTGFAFLAVGYIPPSDDKFEDKFAQSAKIAGYELFGYWRFFAAEGTPELIEKNELVKQKQELLKGGLAGPVNWYKVQVLNLDSEDKKKIAPENFLVHKPVFLGAALKDFVCLAPLQKAVLTQVAKGPLTVKDFDAGHWLLWEEKEKVNQELLQWVQGL